MTGELSPSQVINIPNSMTVLPELLPYSIEMVRRFHARTPHAAVESFSVSIYKRLCLVELMEDSLPTCIGHSAMRCMQQVDLEYLAPCDWAAASLRHT